MLSDSLLILDGGAETTRTVIARTLLNLIRNPDQWEALKAGADIAIAVEEFIRYVTPIHNMCRVGDRATTRSAARPSRPASRSVLLYGSANRDPAHFADPERFDVTRKPNEHIAFGLGTHFCLGAGLARLEIKVFFEEFVKRVERVSAHARRVGASRCRTRSSSALRSADLDSRRRLTSSALRWRRAAPICSSDHAHSRSATSASTACGATPSWRPRPVGLGHVDVLEITAALPGEIGRGGGPDARGRTLRDRLQGQRAGGRARGHVLEVVAREVARQLGGDDAGMHGEAVNPLSQPGAFRARR